MSARSLLLAGLIAATALSTPAFAKSKKAPPPAELSNPGRVYLVGDSPEINISPMDNGFVCLVPYLKLESSHPSIAVGSITDQSGKFSNEAVQGGTEVTQGMTAMVYSALGKLMPYIGVAERTDIAIPQGEIALSKEGLLGEKLFNGDPEGKYGTNQRPYHAGQIGGSDYYIAGAITGINYNVDSSVTEGSLAQVGGGKRTYSMMIEMDLRLVDSRTLKVVKTVTGRKVFYGYETKAGVFNFLGNYLIDINVGKKAQEPIQLGVRATMEMALLQLVGAAYGKDYGKTCSDYAVQNYGRVIVAPGDPIAEVIAKAP